MSTSQHVAASISAMHLVDDRDAVSAHNAAVHALKHRLLHLHDENVVDFLPVLAVLAVRALRSEQDVCRL